MRTLGPAVKVGLTFLIVALASYWAFMMLAKGSCGRDPEQFTVVAYFKDATLLVEKSRVQIAGLNIGYIVSRELNVRPPRPQLIGQKRFAKITIALNKDVTLYTNTIVYKRSASLLGEFYLEIDPGTYEWVDAQGKRHVGETIKNGGEIKLVVEAATTSAVVEQVNDLIPVLKELVQDVRLFTRGPLMSIGQNVNDGIDENRQAVRAIVENMQQITQEISRLASSAHEDVGDILGDVRAITASMKTLIDGQGGKEGVKDKFGTLSETVDKLDRAVDNIENVTGDVRSGKGNLGRLLKDEELMDNVEEVVHDVGGMVKSVSTLQTVVGLRSEYNFSAGTIKTYVTVELRPRPDKYYLIELIDDPRGRREVSTTITRSDDPSKPLLSREDKVVLTDAFRISFQFAKRVRFPIVDTTFRFGIKESTGGVGVDLHFWEDRFQLWTDLFDFQANLFPRLKLSASWQFFKRLYLVGGIDDVLNERPLDGTGGGRDYFLGMQLRFSDEDLLQLLLFGGGAAAGAVSN